MMELLELSMHKDQGAGHDDGQSFSSSVMNALRQALQRVAAFRAFDKAMGDLNCHPNSMGSRRRDVRLSNNLIPQKGNDAGQIDKSRERDIPSTDIVPWKDESTHDFDLTVSSRDSDVHLSDNSTPWKVENGHSIVQGRKTFIYQTIHCHRRLKMALVLVQGSDAHHIMWDLAGLLTELWEL